MSVFARENLSNATTNLTEEYSPTLPSDFPKSLIPGLLLKNFSK